MIYWAAACSKQLWFWPFTGFPILRVQSLQFLKQATVYKANRKISFVFSIHKHINFEIFYWLGKAF